jgi:8-oxo-dGTP pyrophosphatase MutT (NUDIX family)
MSMGDSRLAVVSRFRSKPAPVKFFRISHLRRLCECEQVAAVCYRVNGHGIEFLLVQTRSGRWTFPKGSAEPGLTHAQAAAIEAYEEAGVHGRMEEAPFSRYYRGRATGRVARGGQIAVNTHLCEVSRLEKPPERKRKPTWFSLEETKRRLREDRGRDDGAQLARVVGRAVVRIKRLQDDRSSLMPEESQVSRRTLDGNSPHRTGRQKKDALQRVHFSIIESLRASIGVRRSTEVGAPSAGGFLNRPLPRLLKARNQ